MSAPKRRPPGGAPRRPAMLGPLDPQWTRPFRADPRWLLAVVVAAGLALRLAAPGPGSPAAAEALRSWRDLLPTGPWNDAFNPPLGAGLRLLLELSGLDASLQQLLPRLLSALLGSGALVVIYHLGRRVFGVRLGLAAAAVVALAPLAWSAEARGGSAGALALAVGAATLALLETGRRGRPPGGWAALAAACTLIALLDPLGLAVLGAFLASCRGFEPGIRGRAAACVALGLLPELAWLAWLAAGGEVSAAALRPDPGAWARFLGAPASLSGAVLPLSWKGSSPHAGLGTAAEISMSLGFWLLAALGWLRLGWRTRREAVLLALVFLLPLLAAATASTLGWRAWQADALTPVMAPFFLLVLLGMPTARLGMASAGLLVLVNLANAAFLLRRIP